MLILILCTASSFYYRHSRNNSALLPCWLCRDINLSESEAEQDDSHNIVELPQAYAGRGNAKAEQSAVRLTEVSLGTLCL